MIIGNGMIGQAMRLCFANDPTTIYAAGVSDSSAVDSRDFDRERIRLTEALTKAESIVYFGSCAVYDDEVVHTPYVRHKLQMEQLVSEHPRYLILRLPNVAGKTTNPHTLLNFLHDKIMRGERFTLWTQARRNIIDVFDVAKIAEWLLDSGHSNRVVNVAAPMDYAITEIVMELERIVGKTAVVDRVDKGSGYAIATDDIRGAPVRFDQTYLRRTLLAYYG